MSDRKYGVDNIKVLTNREAVRMKMGMYIGDNGIRGLHHLVYEVLSNSIDELLNGHGDKIIVRLSNKAKTIEIEDFGRGIPFGKNKDGREVLEMIFTELHSGGKMDNKSSDSGYSMSGGTNGVGTTVVNYLSKSLTVQSFRDGKTATIEFADGVTSGLKVASGDKKRTGTLVRFSPDFSLFLNDKFDEEHIIKIIKDQVSLQKMTVIFENLDGGEPQEFKNEVGISMFVEKINAYKGGEDSKPLTPISPIFSALELVGEGPEKQKVSMDFAFEFVAENTNHVKGFTNCISNPDGGRHVLGFRSGIYKGVVAAFERSSQQDKALIAKVLPEDLGNAIVGVISVKMPDPTFEGQTKGKLTNQYVKQLVEDAIRRQVEKKLTPEDMDSLRNLIEARIRYREAIERENLKLEKATSEKQLKKILGTKLTDASSKNRSETELFIVEGDSAGGGLKKERDANTHAIMPLKGKPINVIAPSNKDKIMKNQEVNNLIYAISSGYVGEEFDIAKHFRYGKIVILADADQDGLHISVLILGFLMKFYRKLIEKGMVYVGIAPLFSCKKGNDARYFYSEKEKDLFLNSKEGKNFSVTRFKGLGEMDSDELYKAALSPRTRKLCKVTMKDAEESIEWYASVMGDDPQEKYDFLSEYAEEFFEKIAKDEGPAEKKDVADIGRDNIMMYATEVNEERAIPNVEDGLKNVHRRILFAMKNDLRSKSDGNFIKSAKVVGAVIGDYHPHGDVSVYDAMVGITRDFSNVHPLVDGKGSFGSPFGLTPAAYRYTECRLSEVSEKILLQGIDENSVDMRENFSNTKMEPVVLPAVLPFSLLKDNFGIGYGKLINSSVPHNIREVIQAVLGYVKSKGKNFDALEYIKGPDCAVQNTLVNTLEEVREAYRSEDGGRFTFRAPVEIYDVKGHNVLLISDVPFRSYSVESLEEKINTLIDEKKLYGAKSVINKSGKDKSTGKKEMKIYVILEDDADPKLALADLYSKTELETTVSYVPLFMNRHKKLKYYTLTDIIKEFVEFRQETLVRIFKDREARLLGEIATLNAKAIFADNVEEIVKIIKKGGTRDEIKAKICSKFKVTDGQAETIITTQLININDIELIKKKIDEREKEAARYSKLASDDGELRRYMIKEYEALLEQYGSVRRNTKIITNKEINEIRGVVGELKEKENEAKKAAIHFLNSVAVTNDDFLVRVVASKEETIVARVEELKKSPGLKFDSMNRNDGTLYVITKEGVGYFIHLEKIKEKENSALSRIIKGFAGEVAGAFIAGTDENGKEIKSGTGMNLVVYDGGNGKVGAYKIASSNAAKGRQGFDAGGKKIYYFGDKEQVSFSDIPGLAGKIKGTVSKKEVPEKKSFSSGVTVATIK